MKTKEEIEKLKASNRQSIEKEGLNPDTDFSTDDRYYCETCGNVGKEHPRTAMCWECGSDDWAPVPGREHDVY